MQPYGNAPQRVASPYLIPRAGSPYMIPRAGSPAFPSQGPAW
jgi:hypothetical protein